MMPPSPKPSLYTAAQAPPTPPHEDPLDDIYGSSPSSPVLSSRSTQAHEILSDLPSRQRALDTDAYREGLSQSKGQFVQEGFDEGYSCGANLGLQVGYILGILRGFVAASSGEDEQVRKEMKETYEVAQKELAIEALLSQEWVDLEGVWKWEVKGKEEDPTLKEVAEQHPVVSKWKGVVDDLAADWGVDLRAVEKYQEPLDEKS